MLNQADGALIGSEDTILKLLNVSRSTARQVARILEREGLLLVKRGLKGGYFGARPTAQTIENTVSAYLRSIDVNVADLMVVASVLWIEAMRKAAGLGTKEAREVADKIRSSVLALKPGASFQSIRDVEKESRVLVFALTGCTYIELIFDINMAFAHRAVSINADGALKDALPRFGRAWRDAKLMEATAIAEGDSELGALAGRHTRRIWQEGVWERSGGTPARSGTEDA
ncbi:DNA-binding GntR family transcriptional regulator [Novosphingobium chloroacetimidivorans]|uniref:DNA-binding GntR family transcriptional regulator n=1 Tax=Novosphingobium chloroacetimidivorans TaxID=1428314 RepID=A0A7W7NVT1_9SPHN|nr:Rrf2 family transcriptional regulator [Novosphingobium chloroacetimidivorans]MBB4858621.1 DNA-binding GntR family transcriptional regulator [Novosphingobium chloroacetimidivorans]